MRKLALGLAILAALAAGWDPGEAQEPRGDQRPPILLKRRLSPRIHMLRLRTRVMVNTVIFTGPDGVLMVDHPGFRTVEPVRRWLTEELGLPDVGTIINTHWHPDHTAGNQAYGGRIPIIAHEKTLEAMSKVMHPPWAPQGVGPAPEHAWPTRTFKESMELEFNGEKIELHHYGDDHSMGDIIVYFTKSNVVCMGDVGLRSAFSDVDVLSRVAEAVIEKMPPEAKVVRGHAPLTTVALIEQEYEMLKDTLRRAREAIASGTTLEEFRDQGLPEKWRSLWPVEQEGRIRGWLTSLYNQVEAKERASGVDEAPATGSTP